MSLQDRHENEMRKLQEQIAGLARVIKTGDKMSVGSDEESRAREVEKGLLECVEKMLPSVPRVAEASKEQRRMWKE